MAGLAADRRDAVRGFSYPALDQVISHLAKYRERTRPRRRPGRDPIPSFGGIKGKEHHGESPETYYVHTAGLKVVVPSSPLDAYRLLRLSIDDPDPVIFLEPKSRYWSKETGEPTSDGPGIGQARTVRDGGSCVVIAYGAMVTRCLEAAESCPPKVSRCRSWTCGRWCRSTSRRSARPFERPGARSSCTRRLSRSGWAPRSARIVEEAFDHLEAPVAQVTGPDVPYPPASLEHRYLPSVERISTAVRKVVSY